MIFLMRELSFIPLNQVRENPDQPRQVFDEEKLDELAESIKHLGLLQPILVRKNGDSFELIAGERRLRAAKKAGLATLAAVIDDGTLSAEKALAENLQREPLNPLEIAEALSALLASSTQEKLAKELGLKRSTLSNFLRLLSLPTLAKAALREGSISMGHAKALLSVDDEKTQEALLKRIQNKQLSVRQVEKEARQPVSKEAHLLEAADRLMEKLGTRVEITENRILVDYYGIDDLARVLDFFGVSLC